VFIVLRIFDGGQEFEITHDATDVIGFPTRPATPSATSSSCCAAGGLASEEIGSLRRTRDTRRYSSSCCAPLLHSRHAGTVIRLSGEFAARPVKEYLRGNVIDRGRFSRCAQYATLDFRLGEDIG